VWSVIPPAGERLEMLEEAVEIMRRTFTGELVTHHGKHYDVDTARLYTLPDRPPPTAQLLPLPRHFGQLAELVTEEMVGENVPCGPDPRTHIEALREFTDAGFDEVYVNQIGPDQEGFFSFYAEQVLPELR
jgi:alkanesulfonate monooxygenase SsuD/methylene tetrahydromethanopterin reductase-like flavin-dependent oxidoreductase (luciferase family)